MDEMKFTCTDPDCYQWQGKYHCKEGEFDMYSMCQVVEVGDRYAIAFGSFTIDDIADDLDELALAYGYDANALLDDERVAAECYFEHFIDCFYENVTQGPVPTYKTAADACQKLDVWMGECHMDMWLKD